MRVSEVQNQREAEFRYALTRLRENGESIALLGGEKEERAGLTRNFTALLESWRMVMRQWMRTTFVSSTSGFIAARAADPAVRAEIPRRRHDASARSCRRPPPS